MVPFYDTQVDPKLINKSISSVQSGDTEICVLNPGSYTALSEDSGSSNRFKVMSSMKMGSKITEIHNGYNKL